MTEAILPNVSSPNRAERVSAQVDACSVAHGDSRTPSLADPAEMSDAWIADVYPRIHRAAWAMTGNPSLADDLAQETFVTALDKWNSFHGRSSRLTWLHGILIRINRKRFRSLARFRRRIQSYWERNGLREAEDGGNELAIREWNESVWSEVAKLSRPHAEAITLRFASGMTYQQIGDAVGCPEGTAKTRIHHGLKQLRQSELLREDLKRESEP